MAAAVGLNENGSCSRSWKVSASSTSWRRVGCRITSKASRVSQRGEYSRQTHLGIWLEAELAPDSPRALA